MPPWCNGFDAHLRATAPSSARGSLVDRTGARMVGTAGCTSHRQDGFVRPPTRASNRIQRIRNPRTFAVDSRGRPAGSRWSSPTASATILETGRRQALGCQRPTSTGRVDDDGRTARSLTSRPTRRATAGRRRAPDRAAQAVTSPTSDEESRGGCAIAGYGIVSNRHPHHAWSARMPGPRRSPRHRAGQGPPHHDVHP